MSLCISIPFSSISVSTHFLYIRFFSSTLSICLLLLCKTLNISFCSLSLLFPLFSPVFYKFFSVFFHQCSLSVSIFLFLLLLIALFFSHLYIFHSLSQSFSHSFLLIEFSYSPQTPCHFVFPFFFLPLSSCSLSLSLSLSTAQYELSLWQMFDDTGVCVSHLANLPLKLICLARHRVQR